MKKWRCLILYTQSVRADTVEEADEKFRKIIYAGNGNVDISRIMEVTDDVYTRD